MRTSTLSRKQSAGPAPAPGQLVVEGAPELHGPAPAGRPLPEPTGFWGLFGAMRRAWRSARRGEPHAPLGGPVPGFSCPQCSSASGRFMATASVPCGMGFDPVQCAGCELVTIHPPPRVEQVPGFYEPEYYGEQNAKFGRLTEWFVGRFRRARVRALRNCGVRSGRVLDIGCARGLFLSQLSGQGYDVYGTELSEVSARGARARLGAERVRVGTLAECAFDHGSFDAITAWQVFEHLLDPDATLDECHRLLRDGGQLILAVPNIDSWQARWSGTEWFHLDVPRHVYHYSPATLSRLLRAHGFEIERVTHQNQEQNPFGFLQSALHRLGRPYYGLYDMLKVKGRRRVLAFGLYLLVFPLAALISAWAAACGSGATFTVHARRMG